MTGETPIGEEAEAGLDQTLVARVLTVPAVGGPGGEVVELNTLNLSGPERYLDVSVLGKGGMGEVWLTRDRRLDREVALKRMHDALNDPEYIKRFLREVRVQGQLEHPAVVPVYDLGLTQAGTPYFTMKRVRGQTLFEVLQLMKAKHAPTVARFSRWRLLSAFNTVCLAIDAAHAHGVLHRDLKPGNIMLGDFGEVHVLDWGLAKIRGQSDEAVADRSPSVLTSDETAAGLTMGTPGYMSPEQADGKIDELDARSDVYALGVILHELLFLEPVHDAKTPVERLMSTKRRHLPDSRRVDVAPELDAVWRRACGAEPADRYPSARALAEAVERVLDGERDESRRRELATEQLRLASTRSTATHVGRGQALQALGRALALDPTNGAALRQLSALLAEPPSETPPDAQRQLDDLAAQRNRSMLIATALRQLSWTIGVILAMLYLGVHSTVMAVSLAVVLTVSTGVTWALARRPQVPSYQFVAAAVSISLVALLALLVSPLLVMPTLAATHAMLFATNAPVRQRVVMMVAAALSVIVPTVLTPLGPYVQTSDAALVLSSPLFSFESPATPLVLLLLSLLPVVTPTMLVGRLRDAFVEAERRVVVQASALSQLIPVTDRKD